MQLVAIETNRTRIYLRGWSWAARKTLTIWSQHLLGKYTRSIPIQNGSVVRGGAP